MNNKKGITLVALVVTIAILSLTQTELLEKTKQAKELTENAKNNEIFTLTEYDKKITKIIDGTTRDMNAITFRQIVSMEW